ncbi:MAG: DUF1289 domain-containing protein [Aestuariivita sp.]|nr:DUF1289 domain-containing protein [Aestuariivita sp.]MCY4203680.1 DUF1289 domain-containing protein [Aestuariivita sp.]MCY4287012.1 DUF1289 domain-containing protein [Aestuariivita sp.]MCY4347659.1 DUF1289 domain-containing protein [Aestuariivita sp.]
MGRIAQKQRKIASPCVQICLIHPSARICTGCHRTIEEIADWTKMSAKQRKKVMQDLPNRTKLLQQRRGGRSKRMQSRNRQ